MMKSPIYGKIKHVPNHQPDRLFLGVLVLEWDVIGVSWEFYRVFMGFPSDVRGIVSFPGM